MKLHFLGANRQVTGSCYFLEAAGMGLMIDCGMFQERPFQERNWSAPAVPVERISLMLLTHAHLDHCGLIPRLSRAGFRRRILTTPASVELAGIVMRDAAHLQVEDAAYKIKRHRREGRSGPRPVEPLYVEEDAARAAALLQRVHYNQTTPLSDRVSVTYHDAGHILGSAILEITAREGSRLNRIVFSGDIGQWNKPLIRDPSLLAQADYIVMESTYGDKDHAPPPDIEAALATIIHETVAAGGNLVIPTFAIERPQELMYYLSRLLARKAIPPLAVFLDSPMAVDATEVFIRYPQSLDEETKKLIATGKSPLTFPQLRLCRSRRESQTINAIRGSCIIMAGSGMCTGGRIKHHLVQNIGRPECTILFPGYQAEGTLGRQIVDGSKEVRIFGRMFPVRARIERFSGLSAHADRASLFRWMDAFKAAPKKLFLTHGEETVSMRLAEEVRQRKGWNVEVPEYRQVAELE